MDLPYNTSRIDCVEAQRLYFALRFHIEKAPTPKKFIYFKLLRQLIQFTKKEYLVPRLLKEQDYQGLKVSNLGC